jgi:hypothetical protein
MHGAKMWGVANQQAADRYGTSKGRIFDFTTERSRQEGKMYAGINILTPNGAHMCQLF